MSHFTWPRSQRSRERMQLKFPRPRRRIPLAHQQTHIRWILLGLCILAKVFIIAKASASGDETVGRGRSLAEYRPQYVDSVERDDGGLLVVTLLDGRVVAVRQDSGDMVWTYDTGMPLVTVRHGPAIPQGLRILAGVDGGLYVYGSALTGLGDPAGGPKLERLPITLPELVDTSPSVTDDGSVIVGQRLSQVYVLDRDTGALLQVLSEGTAAAVAAAAAAAAAGGAGAAGARKAHLGIEDMPVLQMLDPERVVLVGREDYVVRSMQVHNGAESWNATYSRLVNLRPPVPGGQRAWAFPPRMPGGPLPGTEVALPRFTVAANHTLQAYDPSSMTRRWSISFDTPPVGVFGALAGETNFLDPAIVRQARQEHALALQQRRKAPGGRGGAGGGAGGSGSGGGDGGSRLVLLGMLPSGGMYAMPADHFVLDEALEPVGPATLPIGPAPRLPQLPAASPPPFQSGSRSVPDATALAVIEPAGDVITLTTQDFSGEGLVSGLHCQPGLSLITTVDEPAAGRQSPPWLPDAVPRPGGLATVNGSGGSSSDGGGGVPAAGLISVGALLLLAAGAGAAGVLVVLHFRGAAVPGAAGKEAAAAAAGAATSASAPVAVTAAAGHQPRDAAAGRLNGVLSRGDGGGGGSKTQVGKSGSGGSSGGGTVRRRKGRTAGLGGVSGDGGDGESSGGGGGASASAAGGGVSAVRDRPLPAIDENEQLVAPPEPAVAAAAMLTMPSLLTSVAHLPSAEARVRVNEDGSMAIGRLKVGPGILGYGSAGTIVYEGVLDGRPVAVKRLLRQFTELARKEIEVLILSDEHPNVVRCFAMEEDREFVYLALERCRSTLSDFLDNSDGRAQFVDPDTGQPTARCASAMLDICRGLAALHARGIVHRDLKPHNVLLTETTQRAKLSDMGLSKQLVPEQSSFESHHGPGGSSGWQAPEQLIARDGGTARQTRSMDVFSLGCIIYYCMTGGRHPFGDNHYERDANILHGAPSLAPLAASAGPEAANLVAACLAKDPGRRPGVPAVLGHPLWWSDEQRLSFLVDISDRIENEDREPDTTLLAALESFASVALAGPGPAAGDGGAPIATALAPSPAAASSSPSLAALAAALAPIPNWGAVLPPDLVANLGRYRRYDFTSLRDLLRVMRNKRNHFREMPQSLQTLLGPLPGGYLRFFAVRFPRLLLSVYVFALQHLPGEPNLQRYWQQQSREAQGADAESSQPFVQTFLAHYGPGLKPVKAPQQQQQQQQQPCAAMAAAVEAAAGGGASSFSLQPFSEGSVVEEAGPRNALELVAAAVDPSVEHRSADSSAARAGSAEGATEPHSAPSAAATAASGAVAPALPCGSSSSSSSSSAAAAAASATSSMPFAVPASAAPSAPPPLVLVGYAPSGDDGECHIREFPRRPGRQPCDFYIKTGHCKFGESCVFDHPEEFAVRLTALGLPLRPEEPVCSFYLKNNECRFGPACKFHHPILRPVFAGSAAAGDAV